MDRLVPIGESTPENKRRLGVLVGDVLEERRCELGYTRVELSEYLAPHWDMHWSSVVQIIAGLEGGGKIASELMQYPTKKYMPRYRRRLSDLNAALQMPGRRKQDIGRAMRSINPKFSYISTDVEPYNLHENPTRVHGRIIAGLPMPVTPPAAYEKLEQKLDAA